MYRINVVLRICVAALLVASGGARVTWAEDAVEFPASKVGEVARAYFEAFNAEGLEAPQQFEETYRSSAALEKRTMEERMGLYEQIRGMVGKLEPRAINPEDEATLQVVAFSSQVQSWFSVRFLMETEGTDAGKLSSLEIRPTGDPTQTQTDLSQWTDFQELVDWVRNDLASPAVSVAVANEEEVLYAAASGLRQMGGADAAMVDDALHAGSITKSMTATIVGALVESGKLDWDTTVAAALPKMEMRDVYKNVTMNQLLQHRAGIQPHLFFDDVEMARWTSVPGSGTDQRAEFVAYVLQQDPVAEAGTTMNYSNAGYALAGYIAEVTAGESWEALMQKHVFDAFSLETAGIGWPAGEATPNAVYGHFRNGSELTVQQHGVYELGAFLAPAGNVHMSASDLARYGQIHLRGMTGREGPLSAATIQHLHTVPSDDEASGAGYACGWVEGKTESGRRYHWHNGSAGTFHAFLALFPDEGLVIASLTNASDPNADGAFERMNEAIVAKLVDP